MTTATRRDPRAFRGLRRSAEREPACAVVHTATLNARSGPTVSQWLAALLLITALVACAWIDLSRTVNVLHDALLFLFAATILWRLLALAIARRPRPPLELADDDLPGYTLIAPLLREGEMVAPLLQALELIDYPRDRLQVILALEWDDAQTRTAVERLQLPRHVQALIVPPGEPRTKPRACNAALSIARGDCVVVYDAEDRPDPGQLREAAARFAEADDRLACLQAPLRIPLGGSFTMRQFSLEYAALFELMLPALARLGAPFPLGGTSNHFRTEALRAVGGWDAWNVTEDADLGFRLPAAGYRLGVLTKPTFEDAPRGAREWMPQRSRWLKGYMQTWGVYMRRPWLGGLGWFLALQITVGLSIVSALIHAPTAVLMGLQIMASTTPYGPEVGWADLLLFGGGWGAAALCMSSGALRAGEKPRLTDALFAPAYWSLQSLAFWRAVYQLIRCPHHWDKTPHHAPEPATPALDEGARLQVGEAA